MSRVKFNILIPDSLSRRFPEANGKPVPSEPRLAAVCRNVPDNQPSHPPARREHEVSANRLSEIALVASDRVLFASAVSPFQTVDYIKLVNQERPNSVCTWPASQNPTLFPYPPRKQGIQ